MSVALPVFSAVATRSAPAPAPPLLQEAPPPPPDYRGSGRGCNDERGTYGASGGWDGRDGDYSYEDPYCHERFSSLSQYDSHCDRSGGHPRYAEVIDNRNGGCVGSMREDGDRWSKCGRDEWRQSGGPWNDDRNGGYDDGDDYDQ